MGNSDSGHFEYDKIIEKYSLGTILAARDLRLTASGDIALTPDGDFKVGDDYCNAMHRLVVRWCAHINILSTLIKLVELEQYKLKEAEADKNSIADQLFTSPRYAQYFMS
ncbi:MAG TPA: hypothetical protein VIJ49_06715 [Aestuariivirga sp.]